MKMTWMISGGIALLALAAGCDSSAQRQNGTLLSENETLKQQLADRTAALELADRERQAALARTTTTEGQPAKSASESTVADTGAFTGIEGVTASARGSDIHVSIEGDVLFDSGKDSLRGGSKKSLDKIIAILKDNYPSRSISVAGFTDTDPIKYSAFKNNYSLGFDRAFAVREYLIAGGMNCKQISLASFGPDQPLETKAKSRRVEIVVVGE
ncbi:MAG: OmpA family protein [Phycisphaerales bacterium]|nr:OmpA family protein [Phycisphaerales bacterium]